MKKILCVALLFYSVCVIAQNDDIVPKKPSLAEGLVLDRTKTLTPDQEAALEQKLQDYDKSTSNQIAVVLIPTLDGNSIEDVALEILRTWGVGGANNDNGIVLLVSQDDKKVRIEVGYGLEGAVTDYTASSIIDNEIVPNFRNGDYYRGLTQAVDKIIEAAAGRYTAPKGYGKSKGPGGGQIFVIIILVIILLSIFGRNKGGGYVSRRGYRGWWGPTWGGGGWSGGGGGGGWSGGGGGGFGGFGGGSGGGGGASGSW